MQETRWGQVALWTLYDIANSVMIITFFLYFSQWLVIDSGMSDFWFNALFVGGTVLLLIFAPRLGARADRQGRHLPSLRVTTIATAALFGLAAIIAGYFPSHYIVAALVFLLANAAYQLSFAFYNPLIHELGPERRWGIISGIGQSANWIGQVVGLLATIPLANGTLRLLEVSDRVQPLIPTVLVFLLLSLPMLLWFKERPHTRELLPAERGYRSLLSLFALPGVLAFVAGYFLFNDALLTMTNNFPLYLERVFAVSDTFKSLAIAGALLASGAGALVGGAVRDRFGSRRTMLAILSAWLVILPALALAPGFVTFALLMAVAGIFFGGLWAVTRTLMTELIPTHRAAEGFSLYVVAERAATLAGPLSWGAIVTFMPFGSTNYRIAMLSMTAFIVAGIFLARRVPLPATAC